LIDQCFDPGEDFSEERDSPEEGRIHATESKRTP